MPDEAGVLSRAHENRQLFSNHYLEERLRAEPLWEEVAGEAERVRQELRRLLAEQAPVLASASERQTEERWIIPVLRALGWGFEVQPESQRLGTLQYPDYALFANQVNADAAAAEPDRRHVLKRAIGVLEAKRWGRDLDRGRADDAKSPNRVPSGQIINYLVRAEQPWGILTNGAAWRLYWRDADFADTAYFAVDLERLLGDEPLTLGERAQPISPAEAFRYFFLFFSPRAFELEPDGRRWLDFAREASTRYARAVEDALKPRAYRAVTALCRGFAAAHELDPAQIAAGPVLAREILDNALTLLFRLLFVLYAEARDLLPVRTNAAYRGKSLLQLRERAAHARDDAPRSLFPRGRDLWNDLRDLFRIIDGAPEWRAAGIPVYNGGLFAPEKHPWLEQHYVADTQLAEALDLLSRVEDPDDGRLHFVDYGPLDVRHLGSIYEGLLEHVVRVAGESLGAITERGRVVRDSVRTGELYLASDKGERKVTGSFYTPDYIVEYIVERTLGPLVEGRSSEQILELRVLDPAMGSGHFLVAATAFLARAAVRAAEEHPDPAAAGPELGDGDPEHLRRLVVERCIFGVDRNPRAVELAKLALWLATVQEDKALNFLDHHLKRGDSLLGARVRQLGGLPGRRGREARLEAEGQYNAFESAFQAKLIQVLALVHSIETLPSETEADIARKEQLYRDADELLQRFRDVADLWASALFGNEMSGDQYGRALDALQAPDPEWLALRAAPWFQRAKELWREHRFFHWDVEFAETFYERTGRERENPGFDAVIGNPPYVRMEEFAHLKDYLRATCQTYETRSDLYVYFIERSLDLLKEGGEYGVIVSNKFLRANYGKPVRKLLGTESTIREIVDFGGLPVFPEATVRAAVLLARRGRDASIRPRFASMQSLPDGELGAEIGRHAFELEPRALDGADWLLVPRDVAALLAKLERAGVPLREEVEGRILRGIVTGLNEAFFIDDATRAHLIDEDPDSTEVIKPLVVGDDIRRYHIERDDHWLLYLPHGVDIARYPAVRRYLEPFRQRLERRATRQEWYELQQPQMAYREYFEGAKILYPEIARHARFAFDAGPLYPNNKCFFLPTGNLSLLAILNSAPSFFFLRTQAAMLEGRSGDDRYLELRAQYMERLPIRRIDERTRPDARRELGTWLRSLYHRGALARRGSAAPPPRALPLPAGAAMIAPGRAEDVFAELLSEVDALLPRDAEGEPVTDREHADVVADLLAFLAERLTGLHRQRQDEAAAFLAWLETRIGCSVDGLSGKTRVRGYYALESGAEDLLDILRRNHPARVQVDLSAPRGYRQTNPAREEITEGYRRSMDVLGPLLLQIELTDRLIDLIVYRLYGLSAAEQALVEAQSARDGD